MVTDRVLASLTSTSTEAGRYREFVALDLLDVDAVGLGEGGLGVALGLAQDDEAGRSRRSIR